MEPSSKSKDENLQFLIQTTYFFVKTSLDHEDNQTPQVICSVMTWFAAAESRHFHHLGLIIEKPRGHSPREKE